MKLEEGDFTISNGVFMNNCWWGSEFENSEDDHCIWQSGQ